MRTLFFILFAVLLFACSSGPQPTISPPEEITLIATPLPPTAPPPTPIEIPPTISSTPVADPNFFRDDFSESLDANWVWIREDPRNWSLVNIPGFLEINVEGGYVPAHTNSNILLRPAPEGNFQIDTQITFRPAANFQFAGLILYESDSDFIQAGRAYCGAFSCVGEGLYMDYYKKGVTVKPDFGQPYKEGDPILLRLSRREATFTFEASTDGKVWFVIGKHTSDMDPLQIGLVTGQRLKGSILPAAFDYFEVRSLP